MKVIQLCPTLYNPVGYTVHGILQVRMLVWVAFPLSSGSSQSRDLLHCRWIFYQLSYQGSPFDCIWTFKSSFSVFPLLSLWQLEIRFFKKWFISLSNVTRKTTGDFGSIGSILWKKEGNGGRFIKYTSSYHVRITWRKGPWGTWQTSTAWNMFKT